ncbi:genetic competence negative regulator [Peribacillus sp. SCS-37]|uniref:genetic competence negative regulator n=1 Tax=Paraperibacillus esterisolvens TaxID=3115296 RepID=UPI003906CA63
MKLERLSSNKIKIFLTFDDLMDRGLTTDDIKGNSLKVHKLFYSMIEEACSELEFDMIGSIEVEIFSLKAQGLIVIVTREDDEDLIDEFDSIFELDVRHADECHIFYEFQDLEDVIRLSRLLKNIGLLSGTMYHYSNKYFLLLEDVPEAIHETVISIASEYGCPTTQTHHRIGEYGKLIIQDTAIESITHYFKG